MISDGEQTRLDFNLSFYGYLEGISMEPAPPRRFGPPAHDQRGKHEVTGELRARADLGSVDGVSKTRATGARRAGDQGERSRAIHPQRPVTAERAVSRSMGARPKRCCRSSAQNSRRSRTQAAPRSR